MKMICVALAALAISGPASAAVYVEAGDAGQTLATASSTMSNTGLALTSIAGSYADADADLFSIYISDPATFSASASSPGDLLDTALFLLDASGHAIATNDDSSGSSFQAVLPAANALYRSLAPGAYFLGIADSGNEPVNTANQLLFAVDPDGGTTAVRGAATGLNPTTLSTFNGNTYESDSGPYQIDLTGVTTGPAAVTGAVPEPATWAMMLLGMGAAGGALRRRKARTTIAFG